MHGIAQARILEWVASLSPGDLPDPGIKPVSPALAGRFFITEPPGKTYQQIGSTRPYKVRRNFSLMEMEYVL